MSGLKVLIVDDSHVCADMMVLLLRQLGHRGLATYDVDSRLKAAAEFQPEIILLDLAMPERDGLSMVCDLRKSLGFDNLPIVALTGYADPGHREQAIAAGFSAYVVKPCGIDKLSDLLVAVQATISEKSAIGERNFGLINMSRAARGF